MHNTGFLVNDIFFLWKIIYIYNHTILFFKPIVNIAVLAAYCIVLKLPMTTTTMKTERQLPTTWKKTGDSVQEARSEIPGKGRVPRVQASFEPYGRELSALQTLGAVLQDRHTWGVDQVPKELGGGHVGTERHQRLNQIPNRKYPDERWRAVCF